MRSSSAAAFTLASAFRPLSPPGPSPDPSPHPWPTRPKSASPDPSPPQQTQTVTAPILTPQKGIDQPDPGSGPLLSSQGTDGSCTTSTGFNHQRLSRPAATSRLRSSKPP